MSQPACECHGETMYWNRDTRYRAGGFWKCRARIAKRAAAYYDAHALEIRQRHLLYKHRKRLETLEERLNG